MLDPTTRIVKERLLSPVAASLGIIHPNTVTFLSLFLGLIAIFTAWRGYFLVALIFWILNRTADGLDGTMARHHEKQSDLGGYLDIMSDFIIYGFLPVAIVLNMPTTANFIMLAVLLVVYYVNTASWMYLAAILEKRRAGASVRGDLTTVTMPGGLIGGTETIVFYALFLIFPMLLSWTFAVFSGLIVFTIGQRLWWAFRHLN